MSDLDKVDNVAASLVRNYGKLGEFALLIRTNGTSTAVRVIGPKADVTVMSEFLHRAAEVMFNGPEQSEVKVN